MQGYELVALVFAREVSDPLTSLVKKLDKQVAKASIGRREPEKLGVFIVFCSDDAEMGPRLRDLIVKEGLRHVVLCTHNVAGPKRYAVAKEADLTVVVYDDRENVTANFALRKGELDTKKAKDIITALNRVLQEK